MPFELPVLPYAMDALEPWIDARTVEIHYTKHHQTYLNNTNKALEAFPELFQHPLEDLLKDLSKVPEGIRTAVKNNGGGVYNHNLYWHMLAPKAGGEPVGKLAAAIKTAFGEFSAFKAEIEKAGLTRFGSGYAWLSLRPDGSLLIHSTANQDCPLSEGLFPLMTVDVWEHAYYLNYQNRRAEYLANFWNLIDWKKVEDRFLSH